jgi:dihydropteroate synthase
VACGVVIGRARLGSIAVGDGLPVAIVGVLNVSPESFYAGSVYPDHDALALAAQAMVGAGASILDVGGMSTAPYRSTWISEAEEADRLAKAVSRLVDAVSVPVSADTSRYGPARAALDAGARIVNDVMGLRGDPALAGLVASRGAGVILMAGPGTGPVGKARRRPIDVVASLLEESLAVARRAGIPDERIVLDPGIGFFRQSSLPSHEWDVSVIASLAELRGFGRPLCVGVSRKSFIGVVTGHENPVDRLAGSLAATALAVRNGASLIRTHDVAESRDASLVAMALRR